jgi:hypothetical protein
MCAPRLGPRAGVHVEVFATDRVVLIPAGIGTTSPRAFLSGRISSAGCYGELVTLEPTGLMLVRPGARLVLADLFRSWGQPLSSRRVASFSAAAGTRVRVFVDGWPWSGAPGRVPLRAHSEIVLEVGPYVAACLLRVSSRDPDRPRRVRGWSAVAWSSSRGGILLAGCRRVITRAL